MYTRPMRRRSSTPKWVERQIDEALLAIAMQAGFLYAHRRARRLLPKVALGAVVATSVGAAAATAVAGIGVVGVAGGAAAWYRHSKRNAPVAPEPAAAGWRPTGVGSAPDTNLGSNAGSSVAQASSERLTTD
jgi:hypothetical protein